MYGQLPIIPRELRRHHAGSGNMVGEYLYTEDEWEFMKTMDRYKRENRRPYPTWLEVYRVFRSLGYTKQEAQQTAPAS
jgi:hypothetical protein